MTRVTRRNIVRALRAPGAEPPADLAAKLKEAIPEDLFATRGIPASSRPRTRSRAQWAIAASLLVAIGSGYVAVRRFDEQREAAAGRVDSVAAVAEASPAEPPSSPAEPPSSPAAPATRLDDRDLATAEKAETDELEQQRRVLSPIGDVAEVENEVVEQEGTVVEVEQEGAVAERESVAAGPAMEAAPRDTATNLPQAPETAETAETTSAAAGMADAALDELEPAPAPKARAYAERRAESARQSGGMRPSLQAAVGSAPASAVAVPLEEILDAAAARVGAAPGEAIAVEGGPARTPGHVAVLFSAVLEETAARDGGGLDPGVIEIALDPAAARTYRLLASHAQPLPPVADDAPTNAERLYRVTALYEIELTGDRSPGAPLGTVRLRESDFAGAAAPPAPIAIDGADLANSWDETRADLRLAVLAAEIALLPPDASAARRAPIARELQRLRGDTDVDEGSARRAAELEAILAVLGR